MVKRDTGVFFKSTKEKPRLLELHMVPGARQVVIKVFRVGAKEGEVSFLVPVTANSTFLTDLLNEPRLSFSLPTPSLSSVVKKDDEAVSCIFIFEEEHIFDAWRTTLVTCIDCLKANNQITEALYLQHLDSGATGEREVAASAEPATALPQVPPPAAPAKPPKVLKGVRGGGSSGVDGKVKEEPAVLFPMDQAILLPAPRPCRPQGAETPHVKSSEAGNTVNQFSTKPNPSAGRPDRFYTKTASIGQPVIVACDNPTPARFAVAASEMDELTPSSSPPTRRTIVPLSNINIDSTVPSSPPTRRSDKMSESHRAVNRTLDYQQSVQNTTAKTHSDFIYNREIQALTTMNEQLNAAVDMIEGQRMSDQATYLKEVAKLREDLEKASATVTLLQSQKKSLEQDLETTSEALTTMAMMKDGSAEVAKAHAKKIDEMTAYIADIETRAEQGEDSKAILVLRDSLKSTKERCSVLERASDAKNQELAAASLQISKYQEELRSVKLELDDDRISSTVLKSTGEALLVQVSRLKEELLGVETLRQEEQNNCQRSVERARAQLETEKSANLAELDELRISLRKREKTINMYEASTVEQQNKIKVLSESLEAFVATKKELAAYVSNAEMLTNASRVSQEISQRLENELAIANKRLGTVETENSAIVAAKRAGESKYEQEVEALQSTKRQMSAQAAQLASSLSILQSKHDALLEKCVRLEKEVVAEQGQRTSEMKEMLKQQQDSQDRFDEESKSQRDAIAKCHLAESVQNALIEKLKRSCKQLEESAGEKSKALADALAKISLLDSQIASAESSVADHIQTIKSLEKKARQGVKNHEEKEAIMKQTIIDLEEKTDAFSQELAQSTTRLQAVTVSLRQAESDKKAKDLELQDISARLASVSALHNAAEERLYSTATELEILKRSHDGLLKAKQGLEATLKDRGNEVTDLTVALSAARSMEATLENLNAQVRTLEQALAQKNVLVLEGEAAASAQDTKIHELELAAAAAPAEIGSLKAQIMSQRERLQQNADQTSVLRSSLSLIERERDELSGEVTESRMSISELKSANSLLQMQVDAHRRDNGNQSQLLLRSEQSITAGEAERNGLLENLRKSEEKCSDFRELNSKINEKLEASERRRRLQDQDIEDLKRTIDGLEREVLSLNQSLDAASERMRGMLTTDESAARVDRLTSMWLSEKEALNQKISMLSTKLETERMSNVRGREELSVALRSLVTTGTDDMRHSMRSSHTHNSEGGEGDAAEHRNNPFHALEGEKNAIVGISFGELYTDILRVGGASETLKAASLDLVNQIVVQYSHNLADVQDSRMLNYASSSRNVEQIIVEARQLFDQYRTREREAAAIIVKAARDESDARKFADEQAGEMRQLLRQAEAKLETLRAAKEAADRRSAAEVRACALLRLDISIHLTHSHFFFPSADKRFTARFELVRCRQRPSPEGASADNDNPHSGQRGASTAARAAHGVRNGKGGGDGSGARCNVGPRVCFARVFSVA